MAFQNIAAKWTILLSAVFVFIFLHFSYVLLMCLLMCLLSFAIICSNLLRNRAFVNGLCYFVWANLNWLLFHTGLMSFSSVFGVLVTPERSGNMVFRNITAKWECFLSAVLVTIFVSFLCFVLVFAYVFVVVCHNLLKKLLRNRAFVNGLCCFVWTNLDWLLFHTGLM